MHAVQSVFSLHVQNIHATLYNPYEEEDSMSYEEEDTCMLYKNEEKENMQTSVGLPQKHSQKITYIYIHMYICTVCIVSFCGRPTAETPSKNSHTHTHIYIYIYIIHTYVYSVCVFLR